MSVIQIGTVDTQVEQPNNVVKKNYDGTGEATYTYKCIKGSAHEIGPAYLSPHPKTDFQRLQAVDVSIEHEPGDIVKVTTVYKGVLVTDAEAQTRAVHSCETSAVEAPIETNPLFSGNPGEAPPVTGEELAAIEKSLQNVDPIPPDKLGAKAKLLWEKKRRGITSYLAPRIVYRKTYVSSNPPGADVIAALGKIVPAPPPPCPPAPPGQNWIFSGAPYTKEGNIYRITLESMLSGRYGWDKDLYAQ